MEYVAAVAGFGVIGWWVDGYWHTAPWGVLIGAGLGLSGATYNLVRSTVGAFEPPEKSTKERGER